MLFQSKVGSGPPHGFESRRLEIMQEAVNDASIPVH